MLTRRSVLLIGTLTLLPMGAHADSTIALLLFENTWARKVGDAMAAADGRLLFFERIPRAVVEELIAEHEQLVAAEPTA